MNIFCKGTAFIERNGNHHRHHSQFTKITITISYFLIGILVSGSLFQLPFTTFSVELS